VPLILLKNPISRQENMDTELESTPKRKGFLTTARAYILKVARGPTKTNINTRQMDSEMQNQNLIRRPTNKSSTQETTTTVCSSKEEDAKAVSVKTADENVQGETVDMRWSNKYMEMTPPTDFGAWTSEEETRRAEEKAKELRKADERLAWVRNGQGYINYNLGGSKDMAGKQGAEQLKIKYLGKEWEHGKMILVMPGEDCEYRVAAPGMRDRGI
jgi:hypothetical protein